MGVGVEKPEIVAAQRKLDEAIQEYTREVGWDDSGVITAYGLVMHQQQFDSDGDSLSAYNLVLMGGTLPDHVALGLFDMGSNIVRGTSRYAREGD